MADHKLVRIRKEYLQKLAKLAQENNRSMANMLEVLIDEVNQEQPK